MIKRGFFTVLGLCLIAITQAQASVVYKWTTPDGKSHVGDVIPTERLKYGYEVIDQSTWKTKEVPPEETIKDEQPQPKEPNDGKQEYAESIKQETAAMTDIDKKNQEEKRKQRTVEIKKVIDILKGKIEKLTQGSYKGDDVRQKMLEYQKDMNRLQQELLSGEQESDSASKK